MTSEVLNFIRNFQTPETIKVFTEGCCYWFAVILEKRFAGDIFYNPIDNHFAVKIRSRLYDITGELKCDFQKHEYVNGVTVYDGEWIGWDEYACYDELDYGRVVRYCIHKND